MADETISIPLPKTRAEAKAKGVMRFFTGKPCKRGHVAERYTANPNCIECLRLVAERDREQRLKYLREYGHRRTADPILRAEREARTAARAEKRRRKIDPDNLGYRVDDFGVERKLVTRAEAKAQGLPRYFTGKQCVHGHLSERRAAGTCIICARANGWIYKFKPGNLEKRRFRDREKAARLRADPATAPMVAARKKASAKKHAPKWRRTMLHKLAGSPKPDSCEVCGSSDRICFEHCHLTGKFRGWVCNTCNTLLGFAKDDPNLLRALAAYLEKNLDDRKVLPTYLRPELQKRS